jgi:hypothetical protein
MISQNANSYLEYADRKKEIVLANRGMRDSVTQRDTEVEQESLLHGLKNANGSGSLHNATYEFEGCV